MADYERITSARQDVAAFELNGSDVRVTSARQDVIALALSGSDGRITSARQDVLVLEPNGENANISHVRMDVLAIGPLFIPLDAQLLIDGSTTVLMSAELMPAASGPSLMPGKITHYILMGNQLTKL